MTPFRSFEDAEKLAICHSEERSDEESSIKTLLFEIPRFARNDSLAVTCVSGPDYSRFVGATPCGRPVFVGQPHRVAPTISFLYISRFP